MDMSSAENGGTRENIAGGHAQTRAVTGVAWEEGTKKRSRCGLRFEI
jgi:hypothetical protein